MFKLYMHAGWLDTFDLMRSELSKSHSVRDRLSLYKGLILSKSIMYIPTFKYFEFSNEGWLGITKCCSRAKTLWGLVVVRILKILLVCKSNSDVKH